MDSNKDIDEILLKVLNGTASEIERKIIADWLLESRSNSFQFRHLRRFWNQESVDPRLIGREELKKKVWDTYLKENHFHKPVMETPVYRRTWFKVAAAVLVLLFPLYTLLQTDDKAVEEANHEIKIISKANPTGQKSLIQLPDGSRVWLNSDSKISYAERFSDSLRSISLEGEAYFDVVHDSLRPFVVAFESLTVTVLGTEFSVSAFGEEQDSRVALADGSVKVSAAGHPENIVLEPGTGVIYSKNGQKYRDFSKKSHPGLFEKATEWRHGKLVFDGAGFEDFIREIKRWYGVQVTVQGIPHSSWSIKATFENELLTNVLDAVSYNKGFKYDLKDKELKIMFH
jgi:ferric-dicitrate binding protein FerR (iron transport regulator)